MNTVTSSVNEKELTICLGGRIDSTTAPETEAAIWEILEKTAHESLVLDAEQLEYISSAGLRVILRVRKKESSLKIINASTDVYEIFEMTGFSEMMPISKAYRRLSVEGCEVIGQGSNGRVYRIDADTIVKEYFNSDALPDIQRERELARKAFILGIPTAIPYDVVKVGNSYGSVFELLNAKSFGKLIMEDTSKLDYYVQLSVELLKKIHSTHVKAGDMPDQRAVTIGWAEFLKGHLKDEDQKKLVELIKAVPEKDTMLHGDYHIKNVMMQNGEVLLIDMDTLCVGHPIFELASIFNAYVGFSCLDHSISMSFLGLPHEIAVSIWEKTLKMYLGTEDERVLNEAANKAKLVGFTRIMRRSIRRLGYDSAEGAAMIAECKRNIEELLPQIDTLLF